jgi:hypothetical protein
MKKIQQLQTEGWLTVEPRAVRGRFTGYTVNVGKLETLRGSQREIETKMNRSNMNVDHRTYIASVRKLHATYTSSQKETTPQQESTPLQEPLPQKDTTPQGESAPQKMATPHQQKQISQNETRTMPSSPGANGFAAAYYVQQEIGLPATAGDMPAIADAVKFCAREQAIEEQDAAEFLIRRAREDKAAGRAVTIFWFKDQRYNQPQADGGPHGTGKEHRGTARPSAAKERIDAVRRKLVEKLKERGILDPGGGVPGTGETLSESGCGAVDRCVSGRLRGAGVEVLPPERGSRTA